MGVGRVCRGGVAWMPSAGVLLAECRGGWVGRRGEEG
jgi:hypothetical protein